MGNDKIDGPEVIGAPEATYDSRGYHALHANDGRFTCGHCGGRVALVYRGNVPTCPRCETTYTESASAMVVRLSRELAALKATLTPEAIGRMVWAAPLGNLASIGYQIDASPALGALSPHNYVKLDRPKAPTPKVLCSAGCCVECPTCAAKPGSPILCENCLRRRDVCGKIKSVTDVKTMPEVYGFGSARPIVAVCVPSKPTDATVAEDHRVITAVHKLAAEGRPKDHHGITGGFVDGYTARQIGYRAGVSRDKARCILSRLARSGAMVRPDGAKLGWRLPKVTQPATVPTEQPADREVAVSTVADVASKVQPSDPDDAKRAQHRGRAWAWMSRCYNDGDAGFTAQEIADGSGLPWGDACEAIFGLAEINRIEVTTAGEVTRRYRPLPPAAGALIGPMIPEQAMMAPEPVNPLVGALGLISGGAETVGQIQAREAEAAKAAEVKPTPDPTEASRILAWLREPVGTPGHMHPRGSLSDPYNYDAITIAGALGLDADETTRHLDKLARLNVVHRHFLDSVGGTFWKLTESSVLAQDTSLAASYLEKLPDDSSAIVPPTLLHKRDREILLWLDGRHTADTTDDIAANVRYPAVNVSLSVDRLIEQGLVEYDFYPGEPTGSYVVTAKGHATIAILRSPQ